jgi:hypothetical protein
VPGLLPETKPETGNNHGCPVSIGAEFCSVIELIAVPAYTFQAVAFAGGLVAVTWIEFWSEAVADATALAMPSSPCEFNHAACTK